MNFIITEGNPRGFFSVLLCVLTSIKKIKSSNDGFIVGQNFKLYGAWSDFFESTQDVNKNENFFNFYSESSWNLKEGVISEEDLKELRQINNTYIKFNQNITSFLSNNSLPSNYMAVHRRGTDHGMHGTVYDLNRYYSAIDSEIDKYEWLYVATDEELSLKNFQSRYGKKVIFQNEAIRSFDAHPIHYQNGDVKTGMQVIYDSIALSKSQYSVFTCSNVSTYSRILNEKLNYVYLECLK